MKATFKKISKLQMWPMELMGMQRRLNKFLMVMVTMALTMVGSNFDGMAECGCHAGIKVFLGVSRL